MYFILPDLIYTKVVGVTMDVKINGTPQRQLVIAKLAERLKSKSDRVNLLLRPEDDNKFDPDAIGVWAKIDLGTMQVGYINNRDRICTDQKTCGNIMEVKRAGDAVPEKCTKCGAPVLRKGLASAIREAMREGQDFQCACTAVTGGGLSADGTTRSLGCNIEIIKKK